MAPQLPGEDIVKPLRAHSALFALLFTGLFAASAAAQSEGRFALGVNFTSRTPGDASTASSSKGVGLTWRFGHGHEGWGWGYGLGWYATDISQPVGGAPALLGELHIRPIMAGYGYTHLIGRMTMTAEVVGGYAFVSINQHPGLSDIYRDRLGARETEVESSNAIVVRPRVSAWYDITKKVGILVEATYTVARPNVTVRSSIGSTSQRLHADMLALKVGAVYSIF